MLGWMKHKLESRFLGDLAAVLSLKKRLGDFPGGPLARELGFQAWAQSTCPEPSAQGLVPLHCGCALPIREYVRLDWRLIGLSSALAFPFKLGQGPTL